ncbi:MAG: hypothetical protein AB7T49_15955 [Oligoflexales bacterium]
MSMPQFSERRREKRKKLTGLLPGKLCIQGTTQFIACRPVDVSAQGVGILTTANLSEGMIVELQTPTSVIELEVSWGRPDFGKTNQFRYGLICRKKTIDLEQVFVEAGCVEK